MGTRRVANSLAKRTTFSSAINIFPNEVPAAVNPDKTDISNEKDATISSDIKSAKPYSEIPGPKELPIIGNSWRFAPIIGKLKLSLVY